MPWSIRNPASPIRARTQTANPFYDQSLVVRGGPQNHRYLERVGCLQLHLYPSCLHLESEAQVLGFSSRLGSFLKTILEAYNASSSRCNLGRQIKKQKFGILPVIKNQLAGPVNGQSITFIQSNFIDPERPTSHLNPGFATRLQSL